MSLYRVIATEHRGHLGMVTAYCESGSMWTMHFPQVNECVTIPGHFCAYAEIPSELVDEFCSTPGMYEASYGGLIGCGGRRSDFPAMGLTARPGYEVVGWDYAHADSPADQYLGGVLSDLYKVINWIADREVA